MPSSQFDTDPRVHRTRAYLREALIELVLEKGYQSLTVKDLAERACINRSTFYLHYQDKDDLLQAGFQEYWDQVLPDSPLFIYHKATLPQDHLLAVLTADLNHFEQLRLFYRKTLVDQELCLFRESLAHHLFKAIQGRFTPVLSLTSIPTVPLQLAHRWLASAYFGVILAWLEADQPLPPEELASQISQLFIQQLNGIFCAENQSREVASRQRQIA
jgi:AcrR family transcriptional regulator